MYPDFPHVQYTLTLLAEHLKEPVRTARWEIDTQTVVFTESNKILRTEPQQRNQPPPTRKMGKGPFLLWHVYSMQRALFLYLFPAMGMFAETANVDYSLCFDDQGKQTSIFCFKQQHIYIDMYLYISLHIYIYIYIYIQICCCYKRKTEAQPIFLIPFTVCSSCKRKFVVSLFVDEDTNRSYPFANS
jgi:hypothetical protein